MGVVPPTSPEWVGGADVEIETGLRNITKCGLRLDPGWMKPARKGKCGDNQGD